MCSNLIDVFIFGVPSISSKSSVKLNCFPPTLFPEPIFKSFGLTGMKKLHKMSLLDTFVHVLTLIQKHMRTPLNLSIARVVHESNLYSESYRMLLAQIQMIKTKRESQNLPAGAWVIYCDTLQSNVFRLPLFYQLLFLDHIEKRGIHAEATLF